MATNNALNKMSYPFTVDNLTFGNSAANYIESTTGDINVLTSADGAFSFETTDTSLIIKNDGTGITSHARLYNRVGGANAGDPLTRIQNSSDTTYVSMGIDNSTTSPAADPFVISHSSGLGTTDVINIDTSGAVTFPLQSSFNAGPSAVITDVTGNGTLYGPIACNTERFDKNADYDNTTYTFTAPVTGLYRFLTKVRAQITNANNANNGVVEIVTTSRTYYTGIKSPCAVRGTSAGNLAPFSCSVLCDMTAGDTAVMKIRINGEGADTDDISQFTFTWFSGYLVC